MMASLKAGEPALYATHVAASEIQNGLAERRTRTDVPRTGISCAIKSADLHLGSFREKDTAYGNAIYIGEDCVRREFRDMLALPSLDPDCLHRSTIDVVDNERN